ncbi:FCD domain-containing protein [Sphingomonas morindae]|uniref:FCD domain-containing protein n=1 Tax=Sphingomonas morindae TaxID=1541170 RepID=A0ABY4XCH5_9SPHN|nr:FCD domain-containing protein [Sphingomonas morindae]
MRHGSGAHILGAFPASDPGETEAEPAGPFALLEARQWVEAQVARCAALAATDADRAAIVELAQAYRAAAHDSGREALDARFHQAIARATHNDELALLVEQLWRRKSRNPMWRRLSRRPRDTRYRARWEEDHDAVVAALLRRDAEGAYVAMWSHIEHVKALLAEEEGANTPIARRPAPAPGPDDAAAGAIALRPPGLKGS